MQHRPIGRGIRLTVVASLLAMLVQAGVTVVLLRLLTPSDYAHYAIALLVSAFSTQAAVTVLERTAMLAREEDGLPGSGLLVGLVVLVGAGLALGATAVLSGVGLVEIPLGVVAIMLAGNVVTGFAVIPRVLLRRGMRYGPIVGAEIAAQAAGTGLVSIALAAAGLGAYAIVMGGLVGAAITLAVLAGAAGASAYWPVRSEPLRPLAAGAAKVLETSLMETMIVQIPVMVVALLGAATLGLFNRAMNLVQLPVQMVASAVARVFISELVRAAPDAVRFREAARRLIVLTTAPLFPICAGMAGAAPEFTAVVMGPRWLAVAPALPYFALSAAAMLVAQVCGTIADASGQMRAKSRLLGVAAVTMLIGAMAALPLGLVGVAMALALANLVQVGLLVGFVGRQSHTGLQEMLRWFGPGIAAGAICFAWARLASALLEQPDPVVFAIQIVGCAVGAMAYYAVWHRTRFLEIIALLRT